MLASKVERKVPVKSNLYPASVVVPISTLHEVVANAAPVVERIEPETSNRYEPLGLVVPIPTSPPCGTITKFPPALLPPLCNTSITP